MRFGAVLKNTKSYGAVRCGFKKYEILRCGSAPFWDIINRAVRCYDMSYGAVRRGCPLNVFFFGAPPLTVGKTVQHSFLSTILCMKKACKTAVSRGSRAFSRGTNETTVFLLFLYGSPY